MNQNIHPLKALLIIALFVIPIIAKFSLASRQAELVVNNFYLNDDRDGSLYLQVDNQLFQLDPGTLTTTEIDTQTQGISNRSQLGFFSQGDALIRKGDWTTGFSDYMGMVDVTAPENVEVQTAVDELVGNPAARPSDDESGVYRCVLETMNCRPFHSPVLKYPQSYKLRIHTRDDSVFITEGIAHKISHYSPAGELLSAYGTDLRYPKRLELHPDGQYYLANTNRHRIEQISTREVSLKGEKFQTFDRALAPIAVGSEVTQSKQNTWPLAVQYFAKQWWVLNMGNGMRYGRIHRFDDNGAFLGEYTLPEFAQPADIAQFNGELLISDVYHGDIYRVNKQGQALSPWHIDAVKNILTPLNDKRETLGLIDNSLTLFLVALVLGIVTFMIWSAFKNRRNRSNSYASEPRPSFSFLNSKDTKMLISNIEIIPNKRVTKHLGLVQGSTVRAKHAGKDIMASFKNLFGGELSSYTELLQESREEAVARMSAQAKAIGANAVVNVRFSTSSIAAGASEILAYGTAVIMKDTQA